MVQIHLPGDGMPPVTFKNFVTELASTALVCLGFLENPVLKRRSLDLPRAGHIIGLLGMLEEKTRGNLNEEEGEYLLTVLGDLRQKLEDHQRAGVPADPPAPPPPPSPREPGTN